MVEAGISDGIDKHWIEHWLYHELDIEVGDVAELTQAEFRRALETLREEYGVC
jgi:hypothetical protein